MPDALAAMEAVQRLVNRNLIQGEELEGLLAKAVDLDYWQSLNPDLAVSKPGTAADGTAALISPDQQTLSVDHLSEHGYFTLPPAYPERRNISKA